MDTTADRDTSGAHDRDGHALRVLAVVVAGLLQLVVLFPFTVASGLLAPLPGVVAAYLLGIASVVVLVRVARRRPLLSPVVPVVNAALLFAMLSLGDVLLGWTA